MSAKNGPVVVVVGLAMSSASWCPLEAGPMREAVAVSAKAEAVEAVTVRVVDQLGIEIPQSRIEIDQIGNFDTGDVVTVSPGTYSVVIKPGIDGNPHTDELRRTESVEVFAGQTEIDFEWITTQVLIRVVDQQGADIPQAGVRISTGTRILGTSLPYVATLPITDPNTYAVFRDNYKFRFFFGSEFGPGPTRTQNYTITEGQTTLTLNWSTTEVLFQLKDQWGVDLPFASFTVPNTHPPSGSLPATLVLPVSDPSYYAGLAGGYSFDLFPGRQLDAQSEVQRREFPVISVGQAFLTYEWIIAEMLWDIVDQNGDSIGGAFGRYVFPNGGNAPFTYWLPVSDPAVYPNIGGQGHNFFLHPSVDGANGSFPLAASRLRRSARPIVYIGQTEMVFQWDQVLCNIQLFDQQGVPVSGTTFELEWINLGSGDPVRFPVTDNSQYPTLVGNFADGYCITIFPGDAPGVSEEFSVEVLASGAFSPTTFVIGGQTYSLGCDTNIPPTADAGDNLSILSIDQANTVIQGAGQDLDGGPLTYRWLEGPVEWLPATAVGALGEAPFDLGTVPSFGLGDHVLTLEVSDGEFVAVDEMMLTVGNSPPIAACSGSGVFQVGSDVTLTGTVSDFDGDYLLVEWREDNVLLASEMIATVPGGAPATLPPLNLTTSTGADLELGSHLIELSIDDGFNSVVTCEVDVTVIDTIAPTLAPVSDCSILWPPNHKMVDVLIQANASDNSGGQVILSAEVMSSEDPDKDGDGHTIPDFTAPVIDQVAGTISLELRAERSGKGPGRVYSIVITATDSEGNESQATVTCVAPHDRSGG